MVPKTTVIMMAVAFEMPTETENGEDHSTTVKQTAMAMSGNRHWPSDSNAFRMQTALRIKLRFSFTTHALIRTYHFRAHMTRPISCFFCQYMVKDGQVTVHYHHQ